MSVLHHANEYLAEMLVKNMNPDDLISFKVSDDIKERYLELSEKHTMGTISYEEGKELEELLFFDRVISLAKIKATPAKNKT